MSIKQIYVLRKDVYMKTYEEKQEEMYDLLVGLEAETVTNLFTDYYGMQLLGNDFYQFLIDEGYIDEPEEEEDE